MTVCVCVFVWPQKADEQMKNTYTKDYREKEMFPNWCIRTFRVNDNTLIRVSLHRNVIFQVLKGSHLLVENVAVVANVAVSANFNAAADTAVATATTAA